MKTIAITSLISLCLFGCHTASQYTSGQDYLNRYNQPAYISTSEIDEEIKQIAAIEPRLEFPARLGLARIQNKNLTTIPLDELKSWQDLSDNLPFQIGELVPVSPLIANMTSPSFNSNRGHNLISHIRKGSAMQHLDYVLIYEVVSQDDTTSNALRFTDLTVLGLFILPSRKVKIKTTASAIFIDVRNGYPYGTASALTTDTNTTSFTGRHTQRSKLTSSTHIEAVNKLIDKVVVLMTDLKTKSETQIAQAK